MVCLDKVPLTLTILSSFFTTSTAFTLSNTALHYFNHVSPKPKISCHLTSKANLYPHRLQSIPNSNEETRSETKTSPKIYEDTRTEIKTTEESPLLDISGVKPYLTQAVKNIGVGDVGDRGEIYFFAQGAILLFIVLGGVPLLDGVLQLIFGPGAIIVGMITIYSALDGIGDAITPFPTPLPKEAGGRLTTDGIYDQMRHPMYAGLLAVMVGGSIITEDVMRLFLTGVLYVCVDTKSEFEEKKMVEMYPMEYEAYKNEVPNKFVPKLLTNFGRKKNDDI